MQILRFGALFLSALLLLAPSTARTQAPERTVADTAVPAPTTTEARQRIREAIRLSGLTPEQVRAKLYAAGFSPTLLDDYLQMHSIGAVRALGDEGLVALRELGIIDDFELQYLRRQPPDVGGRADDVASAARQAPSSAADSAARMSGTGNLPDASRSDAQQPPSIGDTSGVAARGTDGRPQRSDSGYTVFGLDVFRSASSAFDPVLGGPVDANYRLGAGDQLNLILTGDVEEVHSIDVSREGFVVIPRVGQLFVANLTLGQLEDLLYQRLGRVYSGVRRGEGATTRFSVGVGRLRAHQVFVIGDVERPGSYLVSSTGTAMTALYAAGGPSRTGSLRKIDVRRRGSVVASLDLYDYLIRGDASRDIRLETGDIVFVAPTNRHVRLVGEVIRPGTYELAIGESLGDLLRAAGGLRPEAMRDRIQIERIVSAESGSRQQERSTIDLSGLALDGPAVATIGLQPGDLVRVFRISDHIRNTVVVRGHVWTEGPVGLVPGMTAGQAISRAGLKPGFLLGHLLVSRLQRDSSRIQLRASFRDTLGTVEDDILLKEDDLVEVFSGIASDRRRYVSIGGAVRRPGRYEFREGMTLRDLVLLAAGLQEGASVDAAEIARLAQDRAGGATAVALQVRLDSSYQDNGLTGPARSTASERDYVLQPYDEVLINRQRNWELQKLVTIDGEVAFPGQYALVRRDEKLADLIRRAGGFTPEAYPEGGMLERRKGRVGRVAVDFPTAMRRPGSPDNVILVEGDRIQVPQQSFVVTVQGRVNAPSVVAHAAGQGLAYYIDQAGGIAQNGDRRRVFVTQPNGKRQTAGWGRDPRPLAGSTIVVPEAPPRTSLLQGLSSILTTVAGIVTTVILIENITKN